VFTKRWSCTETHQKIEDLINENFSRIGADRVKLMGTPIGKGLTEKAAFEMGLVEGIPVGVGIIDAHAGGLGVLGTSLNGSKVVSEILEERMALICGTSTCHMAVSRNPLFIPGIWGPYYSAMIPDMWLTEGGQSATGSLIDHIIFSHPCSIELKQISKTQNISVYDLLNNELNRLSKIIKLDSPSLLTYELHVLPYFHGNRSPRADSTLRGMISGLKLESSISQLAILYLATIQAIAYGTRHIISEMNLKGYRINTIFITGGSTKNKFYVQEHADITGCKIIIPKESDAVLLGSSILGAVASTNYSSILDAIQKFNECGNFIEPLTKNNPRIKNYHDIKYSVFLKMYEDEISYKNLMNQWK
jgi:FGGY-family pentulose kinase